MVIGLHLLVQLLAVALAIVYLNLGFGTVLPPATIRWPLYIIYALIPFAIIAFTIDREVVAEQSEWHPSAYYYLLSIPFIFNILISAHYLYKRHRYLDTP